ncbi:hypothetical protein CPB83DRAFT_809857 [Crepidotus variabilis]|uniref:Uncharacterized protein n=1 Tax=Crepidotus variabilis TaxID=179855 RepID=A0A9P6EKX0_9AGAR|nr:hypothetical protein CPB83DRAFT_809857 [Crepidotus variabilis]
MTYITLAESPISDTNASGSSGKSISSRVTTSESPHSSTQRPSTSDLTVNDASEVTGSLYPVVKLDAEALTDAAAGKLATSLLGHILFLKNQIPLPIMQLARMPSGKSTLRAQRMRSELLNSYDTISSHLDSTISALSTALTRASVNDKSHTSPAFLAFLVGPSITSAKTKVILGLDGIEKRIWGSTRDKVTLEDDETSSNLSDADDSDASDEEDEEENLEDSEGEEPADSDDETDDDETDEVLSQSSPNIPRISHAEEQKFLQTSERLLSRTLAAADADGNGIISEMSPTQTHILIRAPRQFVHPAWIPRQNVTTSLDAALEHFLKRSNGITQEDLPKRPTSNQKIEGVWITTRSGLHTSSVIKSMPNDGVSASSGGDDNDMLWWSWEGKFVGFSDW